MSNTILYCTPINSNKTIENFESNCPVNPNPKALSWNTRDGWCQWFINHDLIPNSIYINQPYVIEGSPKFTIKAIVPIPQDGTTLANPPITSNNLSTTKYFENATYFLGEVVSYNGANYMNVVWDERTGPVTANNRGPAYSGSYRSSPDQDKNAWKPVIIAGMYVPTTPPPATLPATLPPTIVPAIVPISPSILTSSDVKVATEIISGSTPTPTPTLSSNIAGTGFTTSETPSLVSEEATGGQIIKGIPNMYVYIGGGVLLVLLLIKLMK